MYTVTMGNNVIVSIEDPVVPNRIDYAAHLEDAQAANPGASSPSATSPGRASALPNRQDPPHYRSTVVTISPPGALEQLLTQLNARWTPVRHSQGTGPGGAHRTVTVEGSIFKVGVDFLIRVGNVRLASGEVKGMFLEVNLLAVLSPFFPIAKTHS